MVLIPAHNEEAGLPRTLEAVAAQLGPRDRVVVVADNCSDRTAAVARGYGAEVVERAVPVPRGKAHALAFARDSLVRSEAADPPAAVVVVDADCTLGAGAVHRLVAAAVAAGRPQQAAYRMTAPPGAGPDRRVAAFAFLVKNVARSAGLRRLGRPCLLAGNGMAFPWAVFRAAPFGNREMAEDFTLALDLAAAGAFTGYVPEAEVWSEFPVGDAAAASQRRRWEHGHLRLVLTVVPRLLAFSVRKVRPDLAVLALDVGVPPLSALVMASAVVLAVLAAWAWAGGPPGPAVVLGVAFGLAAVGLAGAWWRFGRGTLPARTLVRIPGYAARKVGLYLDFVRRPQREWTRTARDPKPPAGGAG